MWSETRRSRIDSCHMSLYLHRRCDTLGAHFRGDYVDIVVLAARQDGVTLARFELQVRPRETHVLR